MLVYGFAVMLVALYTLIAGFALFMTYDERRKTDNNSPLWTALSVVACVFWPVTVVAVAVVALAMQRKTPVKATAQVSL